MLEGGQRLTAPKNCPPDLYDVMLSCWQYRSALCVCNVLSYTVNVERFAVLNFHIYRLFQEYCKSFSTTFYIIQALHNGIV